MYFKLEVILNKLIIGFDNQQPLIFQTGDKQGTSVTIRLPTSEEKQKHKGEFLVCTALTEEEPTSEVRTVFQKLPQKPLPDTLNATEVTNLRMQGKLRSKNQASKLPNALEDFTSKIHHKLADSVRRTARIIRWRWAMNIQHEPIKSTLGVYWSSDNKTWFPLPRELYLMGGHFEFYFQPSARMRSEMESLIKAGNNEPLGHELFLEAWELRKSNPRSALIIGMSAAEVGFKQCIGKLVPDAEWLATNAPTPPLDKMLSNYLPELPAKLTIEERVLKPSRTIRSAIRKGIAARNSTVHVGSKAPRWDDLEELLLSIRDFLYLLDYYCGFEWALEYIRDEVRAEMVTEFELKSTNPYSTIDLR
ncbi:MAG TPA: hypothetical protein VI306_21360 [Pyrinomonadaceae bacterium]